MAYRQYTHCTELGLEDPLKPPPLHASDLTYKGNPLSRPAARIALVAIGVALALGPAALTVALIAGLEAFREYCAYAQGGKLICLSPQIHCAIGRIVELEPPGYGRSFPQSIDNDYSIDLLLSPHTADPSQSAAELLNLIEGDGLQGYLIAEDQSFVRNQERLARLIEDDGPFPFPFTGKTSSVVPGMQTVEVPILHGEFEGARPHDVCGAADAAAGIIGPLSAVCGIPILGPIVCGIIQAALAPFVALAVTVAWNAAHDGDPADAATDPRSGSLGHMDLVVITGDWVYDAGHNYPDNVGWNEIHPAKSVQKLQLTADGKAPWGTEGNTMEALQRFRPFYEVCCRLTTQADAPGIKEAQKEPINRWYYHPAVDGYQP